MEAIYILLFGLAIMVAIGSFVWSNRRAASMIDTWAHQHGFHILQREQRWFRKGPYFWKSSKNQQVWYLTLIDPQGMQRRAWVRCGGHFWGMFKDAIDVEWE